MTRPVMTEATVHASYLIDAWGGPSGPGTPHPVYVREAVDEALLERRLRAHADLAGSRLDRPEDRARLEEVYGELDATDLAMVRKYGLPALRAQRTSPYRQVGTTFNTEEARKLVHGEWPGSQIFVYLDEILEPDWLAPGHPPVINGHSAVLPHARGMHAMEQVAATGDREQFLRVAGATVHYIDVGVDTGSIIHTERFADPLAFESLWECKAASFKLAYDLLAWLRDRLDQPGAGIPVGAVQPPGDHPTYRSRTFDEQTRRRAEATYAAWRSGDRSERTP